MKEKTPMTARDIMICSPVRTAIGGFGGSLKDVAAPTLGAKAIAETLRRSGIDPAEVGTVVMGNVVQAGNRMNPARQAAVSGGIPVEVPALTVNRVCGSGAQALVSVALEIRAGEVDVGIAGGMENMDRAPYLLGGGRWGYRMGNAEILDAVIFDGLEDAFSGRHSGWHTEDLVSRAGLTREAQDAFAARSQQAFVTARDAGRFTGEIVAVDVPGRKGTTVFEVDEAPRPGTTAEALAKLRPAFREGGTITAGNAPGLNSGAAAMVVAARGSSERLGVEPMGRLVASAVAGVDPGLFGRGPVPAVRKVLERASWSLGEVERFEINEAFAAVPLAVAAELGLPLDVVNPEGGAIAHGHPIGATGAVLVTRMLHAMRRDGLRRGIVTLCIGGGQGIALAIEKAN